MEKKRVSLVVVRRLPRYYRYLTELLDGGILRISSRELGERMNVTASQIRQDLNCFGGFGQQGYGYNVEQLHKAIGEILGLGSGYKTIILGAGNLGRALANYKGFSRRGFTLVGIFDENPEKVGEVLAGLPILPIDSIEKEVLRLKPDIAILTVPKAAAPPLANRLLELGILGFWNFSHMDLRLDKNVPIENVHLSDSLMTLSYRITKRGGAV